MSIVRTALPLVLLTSVLTGCAGLQKTDWPTCAAVGGVVGAGLGATESSAWAGYGALLVGGTAAAYCWVHGDGDEDGDGVPDSRDKCPGTPKGVTVDANGCPPPAPVVEEAVVVKEETIVIRDVHFQFDKATLTESDKQVLDKIATRLKAEAPTAQLTVTGHTDSVGSDTYNQKLSDKRAHSVVEYLIESGVPRSNFVSVVGAGESQPVADNSTADGRAQNRRTEIKINR
ncbi:hypothetical protein ASE98_22390 [Pseudomonas sp. Leaf48]|jgi:OOP family OmpA-OmpF porin|uniref:OmpA family protein n=1 Tax=unclassified Pseudomonas TaxID=196821 RepID=UPI00072A1678|nr:MULTISPECIES: OmpA family protein [unclassified Pseudomonas]KQN51533.1 hypothetical protein ASE98_22390 [Pseudomonas sp. Leaf48]MBV7478939.1 OmpA family protein [Pseudomonas sp. PDM31]